MEQTIGYLMLVILGTALLFYSLGLQAGRKDGYFRGRAAGMRIGQDRRVNK
jgi:hypothetical protein